VNSVHQLVPSVVPGDATTGHTLRVQQALRSAGYESEIFALAVHPALESRVRLVRELGGPSRPDGHLLYQFAAFSELADWALGRRERLAVNYHNITPPHFFHRWDHAIAEALLAGEVQLGQLARRPLLGIGVSEFNAADLRRRGVRDVTVAPVLVDVRDFEAEPDPATMAALEARATPGGSTWLFVGALAPHKAQHELVQALAVHRRVFGPGARLHLVGRVVSSAYARAVRCLVEELGLTDAVDITGGVSHDQLVAYYRQADVFVSLSRHEGFCVPLLEAMHHGLPIVCRRAGAMAATVAEAAVLLGATEDNDAAAATQHVAAAPRQAVLSAHEVAAAVDRVSEDRPLADRLVAAGHRRLRRFELARTSAEMVHAVESWMS